MKTLPIKCGLFAILFMASLVDARTPEQLESIQREARIVADVMKSALRNELGPDMRITGVTAEYLVKQGVLISVKLNSPWLSISEDESNIRINGNIDLEALPEMVEDILKDLQIDITPYEPEALGELRDLRTEQRELRLEQREIRGKLRLKRRELVRADDNDKREDIAQEIAELERELASAEAQYDALGQDIESQYQALRDYRGKPPRPPTPPPAWNMNSSVSLAACDYGATLKSLDDNDYLTIALRRDEMTQYYSFKMEHIYACGSGSMNSERLLELSYQYSG